MGFNSVFKGLKLLKKNLGNGRLNNLNDPVLNVLRARHRGGNCAYIQKKNYNHTIFILGKPVISLYYVQFQHKIFQTVYTEDTEQFRTTPGVSQLFQQSEAHVSRIPNILRLAHYTKTIGNRVSTNTLKTVSCF